MVIELKFEIAELQNKIAYLERTSNNHRLIKQCKDELAEAVAKLNDIENRI